MLYFPNNTILENQWTVQVNLAAWLVPVLTPPISPRPRAREIRLSSVLIFICGSRFFQIAAFSGSKPEICWGKQKPNGLTLVFSFGSPVFGLVCLLSSTLQASWSISWDSVCASLEEKGTCLAHLPRRRTLAARTFKYLSLSFACSAERSIGPSLTTRMIPGQSIDSPLGVGRPWPCPIPLP